MEEILMHVSARTTRQDDDACRQQANNYLRFEAANRINLMQKTQLDSSGHDVNATEEAQVERHGPDQGHLVMETPYSDNRTPDDGNVDGRDEFEHTNSEQSIAPPRAPKSHLQLLNTIYNRSPSTGQMTELTAERVVQAAIHSSPASVGMDRFAEGTQAARQAIERDVSTWQSQQTTELGMDLSSPSHSPEGQRSKERCMLPASQVAFSTPVAQIQKQTPAQTFSIDSDAYSNVPAIGRSDMMDSQLPQSFGLQLPEHLIAFANSTFDLESPDMIRQIDELTQSPIPPAKEVAGLWSTSALHETRSNTEQSETVYAPQQDLSAEGTTEHNRSFQTENPEIYNSQAGVQLPPAIAERRSSKSPIMADDLEVNNEAGKQTAINVHLEAITQDANPRVNETTTAPVRLTPTSNTIRQKYQNDWALVPKYFFTPHGEVNSRKWDDRDFMTPTLHQAIASTATYNIYPVKHVNPDHLDLSLDGVRGYWEFSTSHWILTNEELKSKYLPPEDTGIVQWRFLDYMVEHMKERHLDNTSITRRSPDGIDGGEPAKSELGTLMVFTWVSNAEAVYRFLYLASESWLGRTHAIFKLATDTDAVVLEVPARHQRKR